MNRVRICKDILLQTYKTSAIMDINATFCPRAKVYFTCIKSLLWLITVPHMNNINSFFFKIKFKKNIGIITPIWHRAKWYFTCIGNTWYLIAKWYFTCIDNTWYLITVPNMIKINPFSIYISQQIQFVHKMYEVHNYSNLAQSQLLFYKHEQHIIPDNYQIWTTSQHSSLSHHNKHSTFMKK